MLYYSLVMSKKCIIQCLALKFCVATKKLNDLAGYMQSTFEMNRTDSAASAELAFKYAYLDTDDNMDFERFRRVLGYN